MSLVYDAPSTGALHVAATKACHDRFVSEGVDLSAYNTLENIEDFVDLRKVLEVPKWSIFGTSYGTLRSAAHDASTSGGFGERNDPLHLATQRGEPRMALEQCRRRVQAICRCVCRSAFLCLEYGDVRSKFTRLVQQLEAHPLTVTSQYAQGGPPVQVVLDGGAS